MKTQLDFNVTQLYLFPLVLTSLSLECGVKVVTSRKWMISPEFLVLNINPAMIWMASASARWWNSLRNQICSHTPRKHPKLHRNTWHRNPEESVCRTDSWKPAPQWSGHTLQLDRSSAVVVSEGLCLTLTGSPFTVAFPYPSS